MVVGLNSSRIAAPPMIKPWPENHPPLGAVDISQKRVGHEEIRKSWILRVRVPSRSAQHV
jgi:hypothetical protein